jgi:hypothetical protein
MRLPNLSRPLFAAAIIVAGLVMASCTVPAAPDQSAPDQPPATQPPVTVLVVVTATSVQPSEVQPTAIATAKSVVVQPSVTPTGKSVVVEPTATSTGKPSTVQPTATSTSKPPTTVVPPAASATPTGEANKAPDQKGTGRGTAPATRTATPISPPTATSTRTRTATPTRTSTPPPSVTPAPHTRTLYSDKGLLGFPKIVFGAKGDNVINDRQLLPPGCEIVDVKAVDFHLGQIQMPPEVTAEHRFNRDITGLGHGWSVARKSIDPRDLGVKVHWWYDAGHMIDLRVVYTVREPWSVDCNVPGLTQLEP